MHNTPRSAYVLACWYQNSAQDAQKGDLLTHPTLARQRRVLSQARPQRAKRRIVHSYPPTPSLPRQALVPWPYGELLNDARTPLADFFRILLGRLTFQSVQRGLTFLMISVLMLVVSACGSVKVTLHSDVPHRDAAGKSLPVVVRVYQLSSKEQFQKADFLALARNDQKLLEKDILWRKEMTLFPNSELVVKEERKKGALYIAVMALFREKGAAWRQVVDLNKLWTPSVDVTVQEGAVIVN